MNILLVLNPKITSTEINTYYSFPNHTVTVLRTPPLNGKKKLSSTAIKQHFSSIVYPYIESKNINYLGICDAEYFKVIHKTTKPDTCIGYIFDRINYKYFYLDRKSVV